MGRQQAAGSESTVPRHARGREIATAPHRVTVREPGPLPRHFLLQILQCVANAPGNYTEVPKFYAAPDHQARPPVEFSGTTASRAALATGLVGSEVEGISASWFFHRWLTGHPLCCTMPVTPPATP
jgi:hypothetical protein